MESAWVSPCVEDTSTTIDQTLLRGTNETAVEWVQRCRWGKEPRSGVLMRLLVAFEESWGRHFDAKHVRGVVYDAADGISRWNRDLGFRNLHSVCFDVPWQAQALGGAGTSRCTSV